MGFLRTLAIMTASFSVACGQSVTCLQTPPGLPGGNGQNGAMFDVQATSSVVIQDFNQAFTAANGPSTLEVYAVTGGGTFVGNETNSGAWTLIGTASVAVTSGPGIADPLGLSLGYAVPGGTTQGFYVTSISGVNIDYTNGTGTPGTTIVASDPMIAVTEGVGKAYPFGMTFTPRNWNGEVCYNPGTGLFANFTGTPTSGNAPLTVQFTDMSITSDPAGIQNWGWDFGDGNNSGVQNPMHTYACPGTYDVFLLVIDTIHPVATRTRTGYITVNATTGFSITTTGGGTGDLTLTPVATQCFPTAVRGFTLVSFAATPGSSGNGPFAGLTPDIFTFLFIAQPPSPGNIPHFVVTPNTYPNTGVVLFPPGFFGPLTGATMDAVELLLDGAGRPVLISNVSQVTF